MLAYSGFGLLALFSILSALMGDNRRNSADSLAVLGYANRWIR
ncbi:MAG: hypothetical protein ABI555_07760 [Chloroflexota bacterium]